MIVIAAAGDVAYSHTCLHERRDHRVIEKTSMQGDNSEQIVAVGKSDEDRSDADCSDHLFATSASMRCVTVVLEILVLDSMGKTVESISQWSTCG